MSTRNTDVSAQSSTIKQALVPTETVTNNLTEWFKFHMLDYLMTILFGQ